MRGDRGERDGREGGLVFWEGLLSWESLLCVPLLPPSPRALKRTPRAPKSSSISSHSHGMQHGGVTVQPLFQLYVYIEMEKWRF